MNASESTSVEADYFQAIRKKIFRLLEESARLAETELSPADFFSPLLDRVVAGVTAAAGAAWLLDEQGRPQCVQQLHWQQLGIEPESTDDQCHNELILRAIKTGRPSQTPPRGQLGYHTDTDNAENPTRFSLLLAPMVVGQKVQGVLEVFVDPDRNPQALPGYLQFLGQMAAIASTFLQNHRIRQWEDRDKTWVDLDAFTRQVHGTFIFPEVALIVANEGRRLLGADRLSLGLMERARTTVIAVSGADMVDRHANLIKAMARLVDRVLAWGERLVFTGEADSSLPPKVLAALDAYLALCPCKLLVLAPLNDKQSNRRGPRWALLLECFEPSVSPEIFESRLDRLSAHAVNALNRSHEYQEIPLPWLWKPLAIWRRGLGGKTRAAWAGFALCLAAIVGVLIFVPYPFTVAARGQLLPVERRWLYSPVEGQVIRFEEGVRPGCVVAENQPLVLMYDSQLEIRLTELAEEISAGQQAIDAMTRQETIAVNETDRQHWSAEKRQKEFTRDRKIAERKALRDRTHAEEGRPGYFWLLAPLQGTILTSDFRELLNRHVKPTDPLLRIGAKDKEWEAELKIPEDKISPLVESSSNTTRMDDWEVDISFASAPTRAFRGKLTRDRIAVQAIPNVDDPNHAHPVIVARVNISDISEDHRVPSELLISGMELRARVRCADQPLGYCLFHGVWEFFCAKVLFLF